MDWFELAKQLSAIGATGVLAYIYLQFQSGKIHSDAEFRQVRKDAAEENHQFRIDADRDREYRESLRKEVSQDRRASDARVDALTQAIRESSELSKRALEFNERLVSEMVSGRRDSRQRNVPRDNE